MNQKKHNLIDFILHCIIFLTYSIWIFLFTISHAYNFRASGTYPKNNAGLVIAIGVVAELAAIAGHAFLWNKINGIKMRKAMLMLLGMTAVMAMLLCFIL